MYANKTNNNKKKSINHVACFCQEIYFVKKRQRSNLVSWLKTSAKQSWNWRTKFKTEITHIMKEKKHLCINIPRPSQRRSCLHPDVIVSVRWAFWRTPHCSAAANYLQGLTPNKSALCEFMLNWPWLTGVPRRWNTAPSSRQARLPFVPRSHPSSAALLCFEVSFISPRVSASQLIRPLVQTPTARCWFS